MSSATPFIVLPAPLLKNGRFEYQIPDLMRSFKGAQKRAEDLLLSCADEEFKTRRHAGLSTAFMKSGEIVQILETALDAGYSVVSSASLITDGVRSAPDRQNNTFLEQHLRDEINFVSDECVPA